MRAEEGVILNLHEAGLSLDAPQPKKKAERKGSEKEIKDPNIPFYRRYEKRMLGAFLLIVIVVALYYFLSHDDQTPDHYIQISGTVKNWDDRGLKNADVKALPAGNATRTDVNGYFYLSNISAKNVEKLVIIKDLTYETIPVPISDYQKKNKSIVFEDIKFNPRIIKLYGDIQDAGAPSGAAAKITIKFENDYLINVKDLEIGKYDANIFSNATDITAYDIAGEIICTYPLRFTANEIQIQEKNFPILIPSKAEIDINGKVYNKRNNKPLVDATVKIGDVSEKTNNLGYYELYGVNRSSQSYQVSKEDQINETKKLSDRYIYLAQPQLKYKPNATIYIPIASQEEG